METVKILLASFDYPIYTLDDKGNLKKGMPFGFSLSKEAEETALELQKAYDELFDTSGDFTRFMGFDTQEDKDRLEDMSRDLCRMLKGILPSYINVLNTIPETLLLAPLKKTIEENDERGKNSLKKNPFRAGGDCE